MRHPDLAAACRLPRDGAPAHVVYQASCVRLLVQRKSHLSSLICCGCKLRRPVPYVHCCFAHVQIFDWPCLRPAV